MFSKKPVGKICKDKLLLCSSNSRELYKEDIFNVVSLPDKYIIPLRYAPNYFHATILDKISSQTNNSKEIDPLKTQNFFENIECSILYINNSKFYDKDASIYIKIKAVKDSILTPIPVRSGLIIKATYDAEIDRILLYIKLHKYITYAPGKNEILSEKVFELYNNNIFVSPFKMDEYIISTNFKTVVEKLIPFYKNKYFYRIHIYENNLALEPRFNSFSLSSEYLLNDGTDYILEILTFENPNINTLDNTRNLVKISKNDDLSLTKEIDPGGSYNLNRIELSTSRITYSNKQSLISFIEPAKEYKTNLVFKLKKSKKRMIYFSIAALIILLALPIFNSYLTYITKNPVNKDPFLLHDYISVNLIFLLVFLSLVVGSIAFLYQTFDKK